MVSGDSTALKSDVRKSVNNIRITNINELILEHLNINSRRMKIDIISE